MLEILVNQLNDRKLLVRCANVTSVVRCVKCGVPHHSLPDPNVFSKLLNDFPDVLAFAESLMFANDLKLKFITKISGKLKTWILVKI